MPDANVLSFSRAPRLDRRRLAEQAMNAAITTRVRTGCDQVSPVCVYDLSGRLGVKVAFNDVDMEGMYQRGRPPRIHLSALRPLVRRTYNCAHELGHHVLGHGSTIDELNRHKALGAWDVPEEYMADTFAGYLLMPALGLENAFVVRGWKPALATASQLYRIACQFHVGLRTLVTHLHFGAGLISRQRFDELRRATPKAVRAELLGELTASPLVVADPHYAARTVDVEVGGLALLPASAVASGPAMTFVRELPTGRLFRAERPGIAQLLTPDGSWAAFGRVCRERYVGRAEFRHLEDDDD